ncbi:hypothetical protein [Paenibacillus dendritiformis]|uniref:hypothetical protein n=1 Tax=Paenibacillus dendritiformis TaxID=130049 RepID=UPI000DA9124C|nr:hypothetical protein [Paenibacillus dendritiformis]PZM62582.1 hypothetical protein DOE73_26355 [Paenibacillus dendritiformis]
MDELEEIWESWDYMLEEALLRADSIVRRMFIEANLRSIPTKRQEEYFRKRFDEMRRRLWMQTKPESRCSHSKKENDESIIRKKKGPRKRK